MLFNNSVNNSAKVKPFPDKAKKNHDYLIRKKFRLLPYDLYDVLQSLDLGDDLVEFHVGRD